MKKIKVLTCAVLTVLIMSLMSLSADATTFPTFTLGSTPPFSSAQLPFVLPAGTTFNGTISATGTIRFWVSAPTGAQIVNLGLIDKPTTFSFVAEQYGNYTFNFENDLLAANPIQVSFSYVTNPDISDGGSSGTSLSYWITFIAIAVLGSIVIIFLVRRKNKKQTL